MRLRSYVPIAVAFALSASFAASASAAAAPDAVPPADSRLAAVFSAVKTPPRAEGEMTMVATITGVLALAAPLTCVSAPSWDATVSAAGLGPTTQAFWESDTRRISLGPLICRHLRELTRRDCSKHRLALGVFVLAHEMAHDQQHMNGTPLDEAEADVIATLTAPGIMRRLVRAYGARCGR